MHKDEQEKKLVEKGKAEGKVEDILELLEEMGTVPPTLEERIKEEDDLYILQNWHKLAARVSSVELFSKKMDRK